MRCSRCPAWANVVATRANPEKRLVWRTQQCANGHRFKTVEIPAEAYGTVKPRMTRVAKTVEGRETRHQRDTAIRRRLAAGEQGTVIARDMGVSPSLVSLIKSGKV